MENTQMQEQTILVAGGYGYGNAGDEAQCAETLKILTRRYPDFRILVLTPNTDYSSREHPDFAHAAASRVVLFNHRQKGNRFKTDSRLDKARFIWTSLRVLAAAWLLKHGLPAFTVGTRKAAFLRQLSQARMLYFSGGGYLTGATQSRLWDAMLLCLLCRIFAVPVVMSGQQIGCWSGRFDRLFARWGFSSVRLIGLRDNVESQKFLEEIGVSGERVMPTHDDALFCERAKASQVSGEPYIAASFFFWGIKREKKRRHVLMRVHNALRRTRRTTGVERVVFVATLASDMEAFDMYKKLFPDDPIEAFPAVGKFREIRRAIADAEVLVTMKHHPLIFAIGEGTPVVALATVPYYVQKNLGAMGQYGIGKCFVSLSDKKWAAKFNAALGKALDRDWFLSKTRHSLKIVRSRKMSFMRKVDDVLLGDGVREELFRAQVETMLDAQSATVCGIGIDELQGLGLYPSKWEVVKLALPYIKWTVDPKTKCDLAFFWSFLASPWNVDTAIAAKRDGSTVVLCESGFLWAADTWANTSAPARYRRGCSVVMDTLGFYFDATRPSLIERMLNDPSYEVSPDQRANAARLIQRIISTKLTKYNHQPIFSPKIGRDGRRKVLVVDQSYGDMSIAKGLANDQTFADMLEDAKRDNPDYDILVKTHPDTMTGTRKGYYDNVKEEGNVFRVTMPINPYSLLEVVDKVYVCSTQLGFEALMAGKEVHVYGMPFYAGWGLAVERQSCPRRTRRRTLEEVFHAFYCAYTHWVDVDTGQPCSIDKAMDNLCALREEYMAAKSTSGGERC